MFFRGAVVMSHAYDWVGAERCWELKFQAVGRTSVVKFINEMYVRHYAPEGETAAHLESSRKRSAYLTPVDLEDQLGAPLWLHKSNHLSRPHNFRSTGYPPLVAHTQGPATG